VLMLLGFFIALGLFVAVFAEIDDAANRRGRIGRHFDQVYAVSSRQIQGFAKPQNAQLFAIRADYPDLAGTDFPIYFNERAGGGRRT